MTSKIQQGIMIYFNDEYPHGYTTTNSRNEASELAVKLVETTEKPWSVVPGAKHWKTGKPAYYTIFTETPTIPK